MPTSADERLKIRPDSRMLTGAMAQSRTPSGSEPVSGSLVTPNVRLVRPLGAGGMGSVWIADHLALHTQVVVKFIASDLASNDDALSRFRREAAAASQVKSPHVVQMLDHGITEEGTPFIVMELLEGRDLAAQLEGHGRLDPDRVAEIVTQLARALGKAHERGIVHRDIKPHNVFLCDAGNGELFVKLLDFGIAKTNAGQKVDSGTKTGSMMGSPYYMSPEQVVGSKDVDHRSDLWSVGVVAYEALTGVRPFEAETVGGLAVQIHSAPLPVPTSANGLLPKAVDAWFAKACSRDVATRFQSAKELADALSAAIHGHAPAPAVPLPATTAPSVDVDAMASTAVDVAPSVRSSPDVGSRTDAGVGVNTRPVPKSRAPLFAALGAAALVGLGVAAFAMSHRSGGDTRVAVEPPTTSASTVAIPPPSVSEASPPPSVTVDTHVLSPNVTSAKPTASARPRPSASASAKPLHGGEDDIK